MSSGRASIAEIFREARSILGVAAGTSARDLKRAYRRKSIEHPPDRDPAGFRRLRHAYELLQDPVAHAYRVLLDPVPAVPPPHPELRAAERGAAALAVLRLASRSWDTQVLLATPSVERSTGEPVSAPALERT